MGTGKGETDSGHIQCDSLQQIGCSYRVCSSGSHLLAAVSGGRWRWAAGDGGSVSGSREATNSKRNAPAVSRRLPPPTAASRRSPPLTAASKWEPLEQTHRVRGVGEQRAITAQATGV